MEGIKGFKVFDANWTCNGFQYEVGETFEEDVNPNVCDSGLDFCKKASDCFNYYSFDCKNKVAEVLAIGQIAEDGDKCATNKIKIVREIAWEELLTIVNSGKGNSGHSNSGNSNSGDSNGGDWNSGSSNSGDWNSGSMNSGNKNSGSWNSGHVNSGYSNIGDSNSGSWNSGISNSGGLNSGNSNSGGSNSGDKNSGNSNSGSKNSGNLNSGNANSGNANRGNFCTGDFNLSNHETGCFCTKEHTIRLFDEETNMTFTEWRNSEACWLLGSINLKPLEWITSRNMTAEEKDSYPKHEITGGYLKSCDPNKAYIIWWDSLNDDEKLIIKRIPNFNTVKFFKITGINVLL